MPPATLDPPTAPADTDYLSVPNTAIAIGASVDGFRRKAKHLPALAALLVRVGPLRMFRRADLDRVKEIVTRRATAAAG